MTDFDLMANKQTWHDVQSGKHNFFCRSVRFVKNIYKRETLPRRYANRTYVDQIGRNVSCSGHCERRDGKSFVN